MTSEFAAAMRRARHSTQAGRLMEATRTIQAALRGRRAEAPAGASSPPGRPGLPRLAAPGGSPVAAEPPARPKARWAGLRWPGAPGSSSPGAGPAAETARFRERSFAGAAGARGYKLHLPASAPQGLIVMLHGCKQNPDDFAAGTNMNALAEAAGLAVAYPRQPGTANISSCWNWFTPENQARGGGEPAILAGIAQELMTEFGLVRGQVFVAGLSSGAAMAAILAETYPELFAAAGLHSGLPYRSAHDLVSAFAVMRGDPGSAPPASSRRAGPPVRTIIFQGSADHTVHAANAGRLFAAARQQVAEGVVTVEAGGMAGRRGYTRTVVSAGARTMVESWLIDGAGHAWSGGRAGGSYADPLGPDASAEMIRFFLEPA